MLTKIIRWYFTLWTQGMKEIPREKVDRREQERETVSEIMRDNERY